MEWLRIWEYRDESEEKMEKKGFVRVLEWVEEDREGSWGWRGENPWGRRRRREKIQNEGRVGGRKFEENIMT